MKKIILISIGWLCVGLAFIGTFVPGIPTTIFLIIALWAFAKSSKKFHAWLLNHKRFGPILQKLGNAQSSTEKSKTINGCTANNSSNNFSLFNSEYVFHNWVDNFVIFCCKIRHFLT